MERGEMDFFSFLPDALLLLIISQLPFQDAVRTCVLSRRWRNLWNSTRNIDLDEEYFACSNRAEQWSNYVGFIRSWRQNFLEPNLDKFRLASSEPPFFGVRELQDCILFAVDRREVKSIHLDFSNPMWDEHDIDFEVKTPLHLPFFKAHRTLQSLELCGCAFKVPEFNAFSNLTNVFLGWMELPGSWANKLISMCPLLETLTLKRCWNLETLNVDNVDRLRVLVLEKCSGLDVMFLNAPMLKIFKYCGPFPYMTMEYNRRMEEAVFDFGPQLDWDAGDADMLYYFLQEFWNVKVLTVCSYMLQLIPFADTLFLKPSLENARELILKTKLHFKEYYGVTFFLNSCPRLETLSIDLRTTRIFEDYEYPYNIGEHPFLSDLWSPRCVSDSLRTVKVEGFKGHPYEAKVLRYLIKNGKALEQLFIGLSKDRGPNGEDRDAEYMDSFQCLVQVSEIGSPSLQIFLFS